MERGQHIHTFTIIAYSCKFVNENPRMQHASRKNKKTLDKSGKMLYNVCILHKCNEGNKDAAHRLQRAAGSFDHAERPRRSCGITPPRADARNSYFPDIRRIRVLPLQRNGFRIIPGCSRVGVDPGMLFACITSKRVVPRSISFVSFMYYIRPEHWKI